MGVGKVFGVKRFGFETKNTTRTLALRKPVYGYFGSRPYILQPEALLSRLPFGASVLDTRAP